MDNSPLLRLRYKRTEVGVIPEDWDVAKISAIASIVGGGTPNTTVAEYWNGQIPWVSAGDVSRSGGRYIHSTADRITEYGLASCSAKIVPPGTTIIIARGATVGRMAQLESAMAFNQTCYGLLPVSGVNLNYLYYAMFFSVNSMRALTYGTIFGTITTSSFEEWQIPLPPFPEQHAIAEALNDVDALIVALDRLIAKKRAIKQGAMQQLLTGRTRLPGFSGEWEVKTIGEIFHFLSTANNPRSDLSADGEIKYIHYGDVHTKWTTFVDCAREDFPLICQNKVQNIPYLEDGDLIMVDASEDYEGTGISVEVKNATGKRIVAGLHTLLLRGNKQILADGFKGYLQYIPSLKTELVKIATGVSVYGISKNNIVGIAIRIPSLPEQRTIAAILTDMDAEIATLEARRDKTRAIKQGMMQELLTGNTRLI